MHVRIYVYMCVCTLILNVVKLLLLYVITTYACTPFITMQHAVSARKYFFSSVLNIYCLPKSLHVGRRGLWRQARLLAQGWDWLFVVNEKEFSNQAKVLVTVLKAARGISLWTVPVNASKIYIQAPCIRGFARVIPMRLQYLWEQI